MKIVLAKHHVTEPIRLTDANKVYEKKEQKERIQKEKKKKASKQFKDNLDLRFAGGKKKEKKRRFKRPTYRNRHHYPMSRFLY